MDMSPDKTIMHYSVTCKIWDGDFHHKILRKNFAQHGEFKLTLKKCVSVPSCLHIFLPWYVFVSSYASHVGYTLFCDTCFMWQQLPCTLSFWFLHPVQTMWQLDSKIHGTFCSYMDGNFLWTTPIITKTFYVILHFCPLMFFMWTLLLIFFSFTCKSCSPCSRSLHHMTHTISVVTTTRSALTWRTNVLRCLIQCVQKLMQTLLRMLNSSSTTSKRHGTVTTNIQRSRSGISRLSMWRLWSKGTRNFFLPSCAIYINPTPLFVVTPELKSIFVMTVLFACSPDSFFRAGRTVAFTRWNTLQSGKAELSPLSQMQRSLSSGKSTHGTGWRMKISTSGPEHASSWRKLLSKSSRSTSDHVALHTRRTPYILLLRNVRYYLSVLCRKLCFVCYVMTATPRSLVCSGGVWATFE